MVSLTSPSLLSGAAAATSPSASVAAPAPKSTADELVLSLGLPPVPEGAVEEGARLAKERAECATEVETQRTRKSVEERLRKKSQAVAAKWEEAVGVWKEKGWPEKDKGTELLQSIIIALKTWPPQEAAWSTVVKALQVYKEASIRSSEPSYGSASPSDATGKAAYAAFMEAWQGVIDFSQAITLMASSSSAENIRNVKQASVKALASMSKAPSLARAAGWTAQVDAYAALELALRATADFWQEVEATSTQSEKDIATSSVSSSPSTSLSPPTPPRSSPSARRTPPPLPRTSPPLSRAQGPT